MKIPVVTGDGRRFDLDTDDYPRLVLLPEVCEGIDSRLWELFAEEPHAAVYSEGHGSPEALPH